MNWIEFHSRCTRGDHHRVALDVCDGAKNQSDDLSCAICENDRLALGNGIASTSMKTLDGLIRVGVLPLIEDWHARRVLVLCSDVCVCVCVCACVCVCVCVCAECHQAPHSDK
jgi:hypothetical protein